VARIAGDYNFRIRSILNCLIIVSIYFTLPDQDMVHILLRAFLSNPSYVLKNPDPNNDELLDQSL
jgi:hypothetical protein